MKMTGVLEKMKTSAERPIQYKLTLSEVHCDLTKLVGQELTLTFSGKIICLNCGKKTKKSYSQGHCFPCTMKLASCDLCILKPETCHFAKGTCREPAWGEENCFKTHVIYLANSSGLKIGITRATQVPTRWMDQGASFALPIMEVKDRFTSGMIEMLFKKHIADKTDWRKMLKSEPEHIDLLEWKNKLLTDLSEDLKPFEYKLLDDPVWSFEYPVATYPEKVSSISLDKIPVIKSKLIGIKGQYLIFEAGVINIRSHAGYEVTLEGNDGTQDNSPPGL